MSDKTEMTSNEKAADLVIGLLAVAPNIALRGFVLMQLWRWFIVPLHVPQIDIGQALGLSMIARIMTYTYAPSKAESWSGTQGALRMAVVSLLSWGLGAAYVRIH